MAIIKAAQKTKAIVGICYVCNSEEESKLYKVPNMTKRMCFDCKADFREYAKETGITGTIESESY